MKTKKILIFLSISILLVIVGGLFYFFQKRSAIETQTTPKTKAYKIGFITDIHGRRVKKENYNLGTSSRFAIESFTEQMKNNFHPDFIVDGGDTIEGSNRDGQESIDDFNLIRDYFQKIGAPIFHVIGNHDLRGLTKDQWLDLSKNESTYYYKDFEDLRIVVLDGNENEKISPEKCIRAYCMTEDQITWAEKILSEQGKRKLVFIHYPVVQKEVLPQNILLNRDQAKILENIFSKNKVLGVFSGHIETLEMHEIDGVKYFIIPGLERSERKSVKWLETFAEISIKEDIEVKIFYKKDKNDEYQTLIIPSEEFDTIEK